MSRTRRPALSIEAVGGEALGDHARRNEQMPPLPSASASASMAFAGLSAARKGASSQMGAKPNPDLGPRVRAAAACGLKPLLPKDRLRMPVCQQQPGHTWWDGGRLKPQPGGARLQQLDPNALQRRACLQPEITAGFGAPLTTTWRQGKLARAG